MTEKERKRQKSGAHAQQILPVAPPPGVPLYSAVGISSLSIFSRSLINGVTEILLSPFAGDIGARSDMDEGVASAKVASSITTTSGCSAAMVDAIPPKHYYRVVHPGLKPLFNYGFRGCYFCPPTIYVGDTRGVPICAPHRDKQGVHPAFSVCVLPPPCTGSRRHGAIFPLQFSSLLTAALEISFLRWP